MAGFYGNRHPSEESHHGLSSIIKISIAGPLCFVVRLPCMKGLRWVLLLCAAALFGFHYYPEHPRNLILITVDTLRADHLNAYGYQRPTSPVLTARAMQAVVYDRAFVQWPKTVPSMVSMFTSTYAHTNGVLFGSRGQYVNDKLFTITEALHDGGFHTYGIVSNAVLAHATNFSQGFDDYKETWVDTPRGKAHSRADHVTDFALNAIRKLNGGSKFFLWIHYVDPHYQYRPPVPYDRMFVGDRFYHKDRILKINAEETNYYDGIAKRVWDLDQSQEWDFYIAQYDAEVRYLDDQLKRLFAEFDRLGVWSNSVICLTADHGESLGENHYFFEHGWFPYTSCSHVPLILWSPEQAPHRVRQTTALLDLAPSLLKTMRVPIPPSFEGRPFDGESRTVFIEAGEGGLNRTNYTRSILDWPYHLVYVPSPLYQKMMQKTPIELYNLESDWNENNNLHAGDPARAKELERRLFRWIASVPEAAPTHQSPNYDPEAIEQMEALGYLR
jgi:arylsulfatase A-like enzyme